MVKIRLTRTGKKHEPHYRIVAVDSRRPRDGIYLEKIGYYNPRTSPPTLSYDKELLQKWIDNGAQMTDTVLDMFVREGVVKQTGKRKARLELMTKPKTKETPEDSVETHNEDNKKSVPAKEDSSQKQDEGSKGENIVKSEKDTKEEKNTYPEKDTDC